MSTPSWTNVIGQFLTALALAVVLPPAEAQAQVFTFENTAVNTAAPFTSTVGGLSATFSGSASVCASGGLFATLSGNVLIQSLCSPGIQSGPLAIAFSSGLSNVSFNFATAGGTGSLIVQAFQGAALVGTSTFLSALPPGLSNGEGVATVSASFDRLVLTSVNLLALDNVTATASIVPEPASLALFGTGLAAVGLATRRRRVGRADRRR